MTRKTKDKKMSIVKKEVSVSKEANELAEALVDLVKSVRTHVADGFDPAADIPAILMENLKGLMQGVDGVDKLDDEAKANMSAFLNSWTLAGGQLAGMFLSKKDEPKPESEE